MAWDKSAWDKSISLTPILTFSVKKMNVEQIAFIIVQICMVYERHKMISKRTRYFVKSDKCPSLLVEIHPNWKVQIILSNFLEKNSRIKTKICAETSVDKRVSSLVAGNQSRVRSLIYQKIEQVTLYKTYYATIQLNWGGTCYHETKFKR